MNEYWKTRPQRPGQPSIPSQLPLDSDQEEPFMSEYDLLRLKLLAESVNEDWQLELQRYLQDVPLDVSRNTDIVNWWSVSVLHITFSFRTSRN